MEKSPLPAKPDPSAPDFGISSTPDRRCKTCACFFTVADPRNPARSQSLCRLNPPVMTVTQAQGIGGPRAEMSLSYSPTMPDLVCFDGWRHAETPPGKVGNG